MTVLTTVVPPRRREGVGRALQVLAVVGVVVALVGGVVLWRVVGGIEAASAGSAEVTADALEQLGATLDTAGDLIGGLDETVRDVESSLAATTTAFGDGADALDSVSVLASEAAPALASATRSLRGLESVARGVDAALLGLSNLPFAPAAPDGELAATVGDLADDIGPLADSFARTSEDLSSTAASTDALEQELEALTASVGTVAEELQVAVGLVEDYRATAEQARGVADDIGDGLGTDLTLLRVLVVLGALVLAAGQAVPWLVGAALRASDPDVT